MSTQVRTICIAKLTAVVKQREVGKESEHVSDLRGQIACLAILFGNVGIFFIIASKMETY